MCCRGSGGSSREQSVSDGGAVLRGVMVAGNRATAL
jgi:hypothetical protein